MAAIDTTDLETRLAAVRAAIDTIVSGGVAEFEHEGGDRAKMLDLGQLQSMERSILTQLAAARRGASRFVRLMPCASVFFALVLSGPTAAACPPRPILEAPDVTVTAKPTPPAQFSVAAGAGLLEPVVIQAGPCEDPPARRIVRATAAPLKGGEVNRLNRCFQPVGRSADSAIRASGDLLVRRLRYMVENTPLMKRMVSKLVELVIGDGLSIYSAATDHLPLATGDRSVVTDPLFLWSDESDSLWEHWAERYADVERQKSLYEMHDTSARDLFGAGNSLWLECLKKTPDGSCPICYQLLEPEQLDRSKDRPASRGQTRIANGIEYADDGEPIAYHLFDAHPYDDMAGFSTMQSQRIPAARVFHAYLSSRASQHFGVSVGNCALQSALDSDSLVGRELEAAAVAAGLTLVLKESDAATLSIDADSTDTICCCDYDGSLPHVSEVGLGVASMAKIGKDESIDIVESKRPNRDMPPFLKFIERLISMSADLSYHRFSGDPTGATFATLRAMIGDDYAATYRVTQLLGRRIAVRPRIAHDRWALASGKLRTITRQEYLSRQAVYTDFDVLGPPLRSLTPNEDVDAAKKRIAAGLSTLRIECGLMGRPYRRVLRQLAVERDVAAAMHLALDFSSGGGMAGTRTTTDAGQSDAE